MRTELLSKATKQGDQARERLEEAARSSCSRTFRGTGSPVLLSQLLSDSHDRFTKSVLAPFISIGTCISCTVTDAPDPIGRRGLQKQSARHRSTKKRPTYLDELPIASRKKLLGHLPRLFALGELMVVALLDNAALV